MSAPTPFAALDEFDYEILRRYFLATVGEMVATTVRAAYSTLFSEGYDFSCALFGPNGEMYAQEGGVAVHLGGLSDVVEAIRTQYDDVRPGDVFVHNDPFNGGSHQGDVSVAMPLYAEDELLGMAVNRGHWIDVGGMAGGGWAGGATHCLQEGLRLPPMRLARAGVMNDELRRFILANIRRPQESWGDLQAQLASCRAVEARMAEAVGRYGARGVLDAIDHVLDYSRRRLRSAITALPEGEYTAVGAMEDDGQGNGPFRIAPRVTIRDGHITVDLTDAAPQAAGPINCSWGVVKAAVYTALKCILDPDMPLDGTVAEVVTIVAEPGTWVRPTYPAPVFGSTGDPSNIVCEVILKALTPVAPERVTAPSYASGLNLTATGSSARDGEEFVFNSWGPGGCGARTFADGNSALWHPMSSLKNESLEVWERRFPVRFHQFVLKIDSGGRGQFRGGLGYIKEFELLEDATVNVLQDRHRSGAAGLEGGERGEPNAVLFVIDGNLGDGCTHFGAVSPSKLSNVRVPAGSRIVVHAGGGGGYGDPANRDPGLIQRDIEFGYCSAGT